MPWLIDPRLYGLFYFVPMIRFKIHNFYGVIDKPSALAMTWLKDLHGMIDGSVVWLTVSCLSDFICHIVWLTDYRLYDIIFLAQTAWLNGPYLNGMIERPLSLRYDEMIKSLRLIATNQIISRLLHFPIIEDTSSRIVNCGSSIIDNQLLPA